MTKLTEETEFKWLTETNDLIIGASQVLFENRGSTEPGIALITPHGQIALTRSELQRMINELEAPLGVSTNLKQDDDEWFKHLKENGIL